MPRKAPKPRADVRESEAPVELDRADDAVRSTSMSSEPSEEDIRMRAYQKFVDRGGIHGGHFSDWLDAEQELRGGKR